MKRSTRIVAAGLAAALSFGVSATAASAAPGAGHGKPDHVKVQKADKAEKKATKVEKGAKGKAVEKKAAQQQRRFDRLVERKDRALARSVKATRVSHLGLVGGKDTKTAVIANVQADRDALAAVTTLAEARAVRPVNYVLVVNVLRQAAKVQAEANTLGVDVTTAVDEAVTQALEVTALSGKQVIREARQALAVARAALEAAEEPVTEEPVVTDPVVEEPVTEEPVVTDPVVEEPVV